MHLTATQRQLNCLAWHQYNQQDLQLYILSIIIHIYISSLNQCLLQIRDDLIGDKKIHFPLTEVVFVIKNIEKLNQDNIRQKISGQFGPTKMVSISKYKNSSDRPKWMVNVRGRIYAPLIANVIKSEYNDVILSTGCSPKMNTSWDPSTSLWDMRLKRTKAMQNKMKLPRK